MDNIDKNNIFEIINFIKLKNPNLSNLVYKTYNKILKINEPKKKKKIINFLEKYNINKIMINNKFIDLWDKIRYILKCKIKYNIKFMKKIFNKYKDNSKEIKSNKIIKNNNLKEKKLKILTNLYTFLKNNDLIKSNEKEKNIDNFFKLKIKTELENNNNNLWNNKKEYLFKRKNKILRSNKFKILYFKNYNNNNKDNLKLTYNKNYLKNIKNLFNKDEFKKIEIKLYDYIIKNTYNNCKDLNKNKFIFNKKKKFKFKNFSINSNKNYKKKITKNNDLFKQNLLNKSLGPFRYKTNNIN